ncbi:hypothetical protein SUGI_0212380 [Cryptomeria japonica]|nr:hypothetical protein SUGI_0212380 [Cryptomeria japonica]
MPEFLLPSCFTDMRTKQNLITCLYQTKLAGAYKFVTVTWSKSLLSQDFTVHVNEPECHNICKVEMRPWLFRRKGSKSFNVKGKKVCVLWDLSNAKYICGPEPNEGFFVALVCEEEVILLLGDMQKEAYKKAKARSPNTEPALLSRREHVFGNTYYSTKAQLGEQGKTHDIVIECHAKEAKEPRLYVRVDRQIVLQVKHLIWKFRGNETIKIDGTPIEVFWDVHNWLFSPSIGHAVFMFQSSIKDEDKDDKASCPPAAVFQWPNAAVGFKEKRFMRSGSSSSCRSSVIQWVGSSSCKGIDIAGPASAGLSLLLYAWKSE